MSGQYVCITQASYNYLAVSNLIGYAIAFTIACPGILMLAGALSIPYWNKTDRLWKTSDDAKTEL